jgi:hypothetical protein
VSIALVALVFVAQPPASGIATPDRPARIAPRIEAAARCSSSPQLVVAVTGFTPPRAGHVSLRVWLHTDGGRRRSLGLAGLYPEQAFAAPLEQAQRFGFSIPRAALAGHPRVVVELTGDGAAPSGARATIGEARIGPAPGEHC